MTDEIKQLERRLSSLAYDLLAQVKFTKIKKWDHGKYYKRHSSFVSHFDNCEKIESILVLLIYLKHQHFVHL